MKTKKIEDMAIDHVLRYLRNQGKDPKVVKKGIDIICGEDWIEVKGCMKNETNIRVQNSTKKLVEANNKQNSSYIYWVWDMASKNPKLQIFDWNTFKENLIEVPTWIIQPGNIFRRTHKPDKIELNDS